jgi:hypothetical protein
MNREPSLDRLAFLIARTTISPNYPGEEFKTLDREVLVVLVDVPPQDRETDEQCVERENPNTARATCRQQKLAAAAPSTVQHVCNAGQGDDNSGMQALAAPAAPQPHQQNEPRRSRLRARDLLRDFKQNGHEVYNSHQANLGVALAVLGQLEDTPSIRLQQAHIPSPPLKSMKEALDIADRLQALTAGVDQNILASDVIAMLPVSQCLKRNEVKTK